MHTTGSTMNGPVESLIELEFSANHLLVAGIDMEGALPIYLARGGGISRVYSCRESFVGAHMRVDQVACLERGIAVQFSNGELRHFEFIFEDEVIRVADIPVES